MSYDVVLEAVGLQDSVDLSSALVKMHGRIVLIGYHQSNNGMRSVNMERWNFKAIDVINGHVRNDAEKCAAMERGMNLIAAKRLDVNSITSYYPLEKINDAFEDSVGMKKDIFKVCIIMK